MFSSLNNQNYEVIILFFFNSDFRVSFSALLCISQKFVEACTPPLLTRREEVLVVLRLVQRMVRMRRQYRGRHQRVSVLEDGHPGGQGAAERRGDDLSERLGFVQ